jgi:hypothetical protein
MYLGNVHESIAKKHKGQDQRDHVEDEIVLGEVYTVRQHMQRCTP